MIAVHYAVGKPNHPPEIDSSPVIQNNSRPSLFQQQTLIHAEILKMVKVIPVIAS